MTYPAEVADKILERLATGESLRAICSDEGMPDRQTVIRWVIEDRDGFAAKYARAREIQAEVWVDDMAAIADDGTNDWMEKVSARGEAIGWTVNGEAVARSKLRLEQRRWYAEKLLPKKYGAKLAVEHSGEVGIAAQLRAARERRKREG